MVLRGETEKKRRGGDYFHEEKDREQDLEAQSGEKHVGTHVLHRTRVFQADILEVPNSTSKRLEDLEDITMDEIIVHEGD